jgi:hypothetical protein
MTKTEGWSTVRNAVGYAVLSDFNNVTQCRDMPVACRMLVTTLSWESKDEVIIGTE